MAPSPKARGARGGGPLPGAASAMIVLAGVLAGQGFPGRSAEAASIEVVRSPTRNAIVLHGAIERDDVERFDRAVQGTDRRLPTVVALSSNGGDVAAATTIGTRISASGYETYAPDNAICTSSCGLIWLAGRTRFASASSHIGFHAAYDAQSKEDLPEAKAWIVNYFRTIGIPESFIDFVYAKSLGQGMEWITREEAARYGIAIAVTPSTSAPETTGSTEFVDTVDEANGAYARSRRSGLLHGLKARYDAFDDSPSLRSAFRCFAYEVAADNIDARAAPAESRPRDDTFTEAVWATRIEAILKTLGYDASASTAIINTWVRTNNNTVASQR